MEKLLPQNIEAESGVLGSIIIDPEAIVQIADFLLAEDFYRDAHRTIYEVILQLYQQQQPADFITICDELERRGKLEDVGGPSYVTSLINQVPTSGNVEYYGRIVERTAILRRLIHAAGEIAATAYQEGDADIALEKAEQLIFNISQRHAHADFSPLRDILSEYMSKLDQLHERRGSIVGVPTGFTDLDRITGGLQRSDLIILAARPAMGKCLTAWTMIDNPLTGARRTIEEYVKQQLPQVLNISKKGTIQAATIADWVDSGVQPCYRVQTCLGRMVEVTAHHPFLTEQGWRPLHDLRVGQRIGVPTVVPVFGTDESLPLERVRLLAQFLAKGERPLEANDDAIQWLRESGVTDNAASETFFPPYVWLWSKHYLAEFLRVLMSSNGSFVTVQGRQKIEFAGASQQVAADVHHAFTRFGIVANYYHKSESAWCVEITAPESVAGYQQEIEGQHFVVASSPRGDDAIYWDEIAAVDAIGMHQVYDLTVPDGANFIAQDVFVHNTSFALSLAHNSAIKHKQSIAVFSLEMSKEQLVQRFLSMDAGIDQQRLRTGWIEDDEWERIVFAMGTLSEASIWIDDTAGISTMEMRSKARRLKAEHGVDLVIVDYLQLMQSTAGGSRNKNREQEISEISRNLKGLAREINVPVLALAQLSRAVESRSSKIPQLSDLRESGSIEQDSDIVMFIYRDDVYNPESERKNIADIIIAKHRNGPVGEVSLFFQASQTRFRDLEVSPPTE